ncbi:hypothetical protein EJ07DRAFT_168637 [Lizonia empirigonia]|nr:hypothetical protein EJ07DRAFT_168637 [Lizonia empirigonia]
MPSTALSDVSSESPSSLTTPEPDIGGNLIGAQNQAAVDGACALDILGDLQGIVTRIMSQSGYVHVLYSVTTEGPVHEIWVNYRVGEAYHMTCYRAWRTTRYEDSREFFRENVLNLLKQIEQAVLGGVLTRMVEKF